MKRVALFTVWTLVFLLLLAGLDRLLLRYPAKQPVLREISLFYNDFRSRLLNLTRQEMDIPQAVRDPLTVPGLKTKPMPAPVSASPGGEKKSPAKNAGPGYVYADDEGNLQFADRLGDIPDRYRARANPLDR